MNTSYFVLALGYTVICVAAAFLLREKFPHKYSIGLILCVFAPAWGHIYVKSKYNWVSWMIFMSLERGVNKASAGDDSLIPWLVIGGLSAFVMYFRILSAKRVPISNPQPTDDDKDRNYFADLDKKLEEAGVETERDLLR